MEIHLPIPLYFWFYKEFVSSHPMTLHANSILFDHIYFVSSMGAKYCVSVSVCVCLYLLNRKLSYRRETCATLCII